LKPDAEVHQTAVCGSPSSAANLAEKSASNPKPQAGVRRFDAGVHASAVLRRTRRNMVHQTM
jgi:hypothetical protein